MPNDVNILSIQCINRQKDMESPLFLYLYVYIYIYDVCIYIYTHTSILYLCISDSISMYMN